MTVQSKTTSRISSLVGQLESTLRQFGEDSATEQHVHKLRTTVRRLEVALQSAPEASGTKRVRKQLTEIRRKAGEVRDLDVQLKLMEELQDGGPSGGYAELSSRMRRRRHKQEQKLLKLVGREQASGLDDRLAQLKATAASAPNNGTGNGNDSPERIREEYLQMSVEIPQGGTALHDFRKACKRLRYRLEALKGRESDKAIEGLKNVQDTVGRWHDWVALTEFAQEHLDLHDRSMAAMLRSKTVAALREGLHAAQMLRSEFQTHSIQRKPPASARAPRQRHLTGATR